MKASKLLFLALAIIVASSGLAIAQITIDQPGNSRPATRPADESDNELVDEIFAPITARLNLTEKQKFRIANIATNTMLQVEPLFQQLDDLDDQLSQAALTGRLEESTLRQISDRQAAVLSQIISMKMRAKMSFYRLLTDEQRAVVADQFRSRAAEGSLGSIIN